MEVKVLEQRDIIDLKELIENDNMVYEFNNILNFIETPNAYGFIVKEDNKIIGFAYGYILTRLDNKKMFYLHSIDILPLYQQKGYGRKLLNYIIDYTKQKNIYKLFVITDKSNTKACNLYKYCGGKNHYDNEIVYVFDKE